MKRDELTEPLRGAEIEVKHSEQPQEEWTVDYIIGLRDKHGWEAIVDAINAALAALRENHKHQIELIGEGCIKVDQQLAAAKNAADEFFRANGMLTQQLADEQEKWLKQSNHLYKMIQERDIQVDSANALLSEMTKEFHELKYQLTTEREKDHCSQCWHCKALKNEKEAKNG